MFFKPGLTRARKLRKKKLKAKIKAIPITRFCIDIDFYDAGDTWGLLHEFSYLTPITGYSGTHPNKGIKIGIDGLVTVPKDFLFNASGPTIDTDDAIRAACFHDALYDLHDAGLIPDCKRKVVDQLFYDMLLEDGMTPIRAKYWHIGVRLGGWVSWNN